MLRKWIYILSQFQDTLKSWKTNDYFNDSKRKRIALSGRGITFIVGIAFICFNQKTHLNLIKSLMKIKIFMVFRWLLKTIRC